MDNQDTIDDLRAEVERLSIEAGLSGSTEAFRLLDQGALNGTLLEMELRMLRFLEERQ